MEDIKEYLKSHPPKGFKINPHYYSAKKCDMLEVFFEESLCYVVKLTDRVSIYKAEDDRRITGVKIYGVGKLVDEERVVTTKEIENG